MKITEAGTKDIKKIQELAKESWENAYAEILGREQIDYMLSKMYSDQEITSHMQNPNYQYYLVSDDDGVEVGFVGFEHHYEPLTTKLHRIYLIPKAKGLGFGKASISFIEQKTKESGDQRIILNVNKENNARFVYEKQGFTVQKEIILEIGNGYIMDDYILEKNIQ